MILLSILCTCFIAVCSSLTKNPISASTSGFLPCDCRANVRVSKGGNASITCYNISNPSSIKARRWDIIKDNMFEKNNSNVIIALEGTERKMESNENATLLFNRENSSLTLVLYNVEKSGTYGFRIEVEDDRDLIKPDECQAASSEVVDHIVETPRKAYWWVFLAVALLLVMGVLAAMSHKIKKRTPVYKPGHVDSEEEVRLGEPLPDHQPSMV
ncbi:uncharacterized protein LOC128471751 isoform X2 [Spea bombifrons]|uniref:uncharacterized protein LOC128471751 isoform X2 n=1 Tax=Spea bombifrons TaxID=233779 RepID=UPI00234B36F8|nr:uncharacterized protein LOC128471751 isoform X2 [Spea bombifrons]